MSFSAKPSSTSPGAALWDGDAAGAWLGNNDSVA